MSRTKIMAGLSALCMLAFGAACSSDPEIVEKIVEVEKEVINIVVSADQVDHIFEKMYLAGNLDTPGKGIMFITPLDKAATYIPPEVLEKLGSPEEGAEKVAE